MTVRLRPTAPLNLPVLKLFVVVPLKFQRFFFSFLDNPFKAPDLLSSFLAALSV